MKLTSLFIIVFLYLLTGCAVKPKSSVTEDQQLLLKPDIAKVDEWSVKGRLGIKTEDSANSLNFSWQHTASKQLLLLYGSFGNTYAKLQINDGLATLELDDNRTFQSDNVELLLKETLGHPLPLNQLVYWIKGLPYPGEKTVSNYTPEGRLKSLDYKQWKITFSKYKKQPSFHHFILPSKIKMKDGLTTLNLSLRRWSPETNL